MLRDPRRRHEGRDRDRQHVDRVLEAEFVRQPRNDLAERMLGKPTGDELKMLRRQMTRPE